MNNKFHPSDRRGMVGSTDWLPWQKWLKKSQQNDESLTKRYPDMRITHGKSRTASETSYLHEERLGLLWMDWINGDKGRWRMSCINKRARSSCLDDAEAFLNDLWDSDHKLGFLWVMWCLYSDLHDGRTQWFLLRWVMHVKREEFMEEMWYSPRSGRFIRWKSQVP